MSHSKKTDDPVTNSTGIGIALGAAFGAAIGAALDNIAMGVALGVALGVAIGPSLMKKNLDAEELTHHPPEDETI